MTPQLLILIGTVGAIAVAIGVEAYIKRGRKRPLAARYGRARSTIELGLEATDMSVVDAIQKRNAAFDRKTGQGSDGVSWIETHSIAPEPYPDDETYAARFIGTHRERK